MEGALPKTEVCMIFIPNYHWDHTKFEFGMIPVVIWYEYHTSISAVDGSGGEK